MDPHLFFSIAFRHPEDLRLAFSYAHFLTVPTELLAQEAKREEGD
jgi:hypothetical protein